MLVTGKLEIFKNKNGYLSAVFKAWNDDNEVTGKAYMDAKLPEDIKVEDGQSLTIEVKEGYLNAVHVDGENPFNKLKINVVKCDVLDVFPKPETKKAKKSKKTSKGGK